MIDYRYTHISTEATTGYFACLPFPEPSPEEALRYLAAHPFDDFMRRHLLSRMGHMDAQALAALFGRAFPAPPLPPALLALKRELALLDPALAAHPFFADSGGDDDESGQSPLIFLRHESLPDRHLHRLWGELFEANIQGHRALKAPELLGLPPLYPDRPAADSGLPGCAAAFTAPFVCSLPELHARHCGGAQSAAPGPATLEEIAALAEERLSSLDIIAGPEMRHTASLSPVALQRPWNIRLRVRRGRHDFSLQGQATTYGRGLSVAAARVSCLMEMAERASVYLSAGEEGLEDRARPCPLVRGSRSEILDRYGFALDPNEYPLDVPYTDAPLNWLEGESPGASGAEKLYVPAQMAGLFCNLDEISLFDSPGSTGIATGLTTEQARLAALLEIVERDAEATTPFSKSACFTLEADPAQEPVLAALLEDYKVRGIKVQFQDLTGPLGVPVFKCFVMGLKGAVSRGHGAGLSAKRAIVSALTETPFPYPDGGPSGPLLRKLPARPYRELPDYSLGSHAADLALLEDLLARNKRRPVYVDLTHKGIAFPVVRALVPGFELAADKDAFSRVPYRLYNAYRAMFEAAPA